MDTKYVITILVIAALVVGGYLSFNSGATVSAQGVSQLSVQPDEVSIYLTITTKNDSAATAKDMNSLISDKVIMELIKLGIERKDIQTETFSIYPNYEYDYGRNEQKGYVANQPITVKIESFDKVGAIVDKSVDAGALVSYINFELSQEKQNEFKAQALSDASKDAERKAKATAAGLGKKLGRLVSVGSQDFNYVPIAYYARSGAEDMAEVKKAAINIVPKDLEVSATVSVSYKLRGF